MRRGAICLRGDLHAGKGYLSAGGLACREGRFDCGEGDWFGREPGRGIGAGSRRVIGGVQGSCLIAEVSDEIVDLTHSRDARSGDCGMGAVVFVAEMPLLSRGNG